MSILWCGGEDIDFPNGFAVQSLLVDPTNPFSGIPIFRAGYARCSIWPLAQFTVSKSTVFAGGAVTSAWLSFEFWNYGFGGGTSMTDLIGLGLSGSNSALYLGSASGDTHKLALSKFDGTTRTQLAAEIGTSLQNIGFGAACTVNVYLNGAFLFTFAGDVTVPGMAAFDSVFLGFTPTISGSWYGVSEIIVADEDTRGFLGLQTDPPAGAGTVSAWTGAYTDINEVTIDDATVITTNTPGLDWEATIPALVPGASGVRGVKIAARASTPLGSAATKVGLGVRSGGLVDPGALQSPGVAFNTLERFMPVNPITGLPWTAADMNALELNLRSGA